MSSGEFKHRLALTLRRYPWVVGAARQVWQFTRPRFSMGVVGVAFNDTGHVLLAEHVFHPYVPWGLPGGWVERNEDPAVGLRREFMEELSLEVEVGPVIGVEIIDKGHIDLAYLCYPLGSVGALSYELLAYQWVSPAQLPRTHLFHRRAIQRAQHLLTVETRI